MRKPRIWFGAVLCVLFLVATLLTLLSLRVRTTFLSPGFISEHLSRSGVTKPLRHELINAGMDRLFEEALGNTGGDEVTESRVPSAIEVAARREMLELSDDVFPDPWILERARASVSAFLPYLMGERDHVDVVLPVAPEPAQTAAALAKHLPQSEAMELLYEEVISMMSQKILERYPGLLLGKDPEHEDLSRLLRALLPQKWIVSRIAKASFQLTAYLVGDLDHFELFLPIHKQSNLADEIERLLLKANLSQFFLEYIVRPAIQQGIGERLPLPWQLELQEEEILWGFEEVLSEEWVQENKLPLVQALSAYMLGEADGFELHISLLDRREAAAKVLTTLILVKLRERLDTLPLCENFQDFRAQLDDVDAPLHCSLEGFESIGVLILLDIRLSIRLNEALSAHIPDVWTYTDGQFREQFGASMWFWIEETREALRSGLSITDEDMREYLDPKKEARFNRLLSTLRDGLRWSDESISEAPIEYQEKLSLLRSLLGKIQGITLFFLPLSILTWFGAVFFLARAPLVRFRVGLWLISASGLCTLLASWMLEDSLHLYAVSLASLIPWSRLEGGFQVFFGGAAESFLHGIRWYTVPLILIPTSLALGLEWTLRRGSQRGPCIQGGAGGCVKKGAAQGCEIQRRPPSK